MYRYDSKGKKEEENLYVHLINQVFGIDQTKFDSYK
jgi:hypothetical protein